MEISIAIIISSVTGLILIGVQIGSFTRSFISRYEWIREKQTFRYEFQEMEQKILDSEKLKKKKKFLKCILNLMRF